MRYQVFLHNRLIGQFPLECLNAAYDMASKVRGILIDTLTKQELHRTKEGGQTTPLTGRQK